MTSAIVTTPAGPGDGDRREARRRGDRGAFRAVAPLALLVLSWPAPVFADPPDPLLPLILRIESYFHRHEIEGITRDVRYPVNPSEVIRLSVVSQLLGYYDLYVATGNPVYLQDIRSRADFLHARFNEITSRTAFDGMLGYALLGAYEVTGDARYFERAVVIVNRLRALRGFNITLNWGLMAALALSKYHQLTGDPDALRKTIEIVDSLRPYQNADGSFPHYCARSRDVHYTAWMGMELITIRRHVSYAPIDGLLEGVRRFLNGRVDDSGRTRYVEPCPDRPNCWIYYYSIASGCPFDYDTRAWINELGYTALVFDHFREPKYTPVMGFLYDLSRFGTFADKWDYFPPPSDPIHPWASADTSVIRTSVVFWSLASILRSRGDRVPTRLAAVAAAEADIWRTHGDEPEPPDDVPPVWTTGWMTVDSLVVAGADMDEVCGRAGVAGDLREPEPGEPGGTGRRVISPESARPEARAPVAPIRLGRVAPSPAREFAVLEFSLEREADVAVTIADIGGRQIRTLFAGRRQAGRYAVRWDRRDASGRRVAPGVYLLTVRADGQTAGVKSLVIL